MLNLCYNIKIIAHINQMERVYMNIQELFSRIKQLSFNPKDKIYSRSFLIDRSKEDCFEMAGQEIKTQKINSVNCQYVIVPKDTISACGITAKGLLSAIHGQQYDGSTGVSLDTLNEEIATNAKSLQSATSDNVYTYDISFEGYVTNTTGNNFEGHSVAHNFVVLQYKNSYDEVRYRLYQSYVKQHSLYEFIEEAESKNNNNDFSQEEFNDFIKQVNAFSKASVWTKEIETFHQRYFNVKTEYTDWKIARGVNVDISEAALCPS